MVFEYIQERFRGAYRYFACPQSRNRELGKRRSGRKRTKHCSDPERDASEEGEGVAEGEVMRGKRVAARHRRTKAQDDKVGSEEEEEDGIDRRYGKDEDDYVDEEGEDEESLSVGLADLLLSKREKKMAANVKREGREPPSDNGSPSPQNGLLDSEEEEEDEEEEEEEQEEIAPEDLEYVFDKMIFTGGKVTFCY